MRGVSAELVSDYQTLYYQVSGFRDQEREIGNSKINT